MARRTRRVRVGSGMTVRMALPGNHILTIFKLMGSSFTKPNASAAFTKTTARMQWAQRRLLGHCQLKDASACLFSRIREEEVRM